MPRDRVLLMIAMATVVAVDVALPRSIAAQYVNALRAARGAAEQLRRGGDAQAQPAQPPAGRGPATVPATPPASGSAPAPAPATQQTASAEKVDPQQLIEPAGFDYKPEGRRDPFVSLVRPAGNARQGTSAPGPRPAGIAGLQVSEVTLKGTIRGRDGFVAILLGSDQKTYIVRSGDRLFDGTIQSISQSDLVVVQQVNDPTSLAKQREVRKVLAKTEANQ